MLKYFALTLLLSAPLSAEIYELRTYTANDGKLESLLTRFREHTTTIFESHGIKNVGYWLTEGEGDARKLVYLVTHKDRETAKSNWKAFRADPKWQSAYKASITDGKLVKKITSEYLTPTDFSSLK